MGCMDPNLLPGHPQGGCCLCFIEVALGGRGAPGCLWPARGLTQCLDLLSVDINTNSA